MGIEWAGQFNTLNTLNDLISTISDHLELEELEEEYLRAIGMLIPAHANAIYLFNPNNPRPIRIAAAGVDVDFLSYYEKKGREIDPLRAWIFENRSPNQSQLLCGLEGWRLHPVYHIVGTAEIDFAMQCPIISDAEVIGTLNFGRAISEGQFTELDLTAIQILSRFVGLSITKTLGCGSQPKDLENLCRAIDRVKQGIVIVDNKYAIQYANQAAQRIAENTFGCEQPAKDLSDLIRGDCQKNRPKSLAVKEVSTISCFLPGWQSKQTLVFLDEVVSPSALRLLQEILTKRELDVIRLVELGMNNREIANELNISVNTVKRHLDNLYCKLNVYSRTELISKIYRLVNIT